ncbi:MAG: DUF2752 domain-containing protein [Candidatus Eisenbacteria bacterium]
MRGRAGEEPGGRSLALVWGLLFGGAAIGTVIGARILSEVFRYAVPCPFHLATGAPCPTCHGLRALAALGRGEIGAALALNPLFTTAAILLAAWGVLSGLLLLLGRRDPPGALGERGRLVLRWGIPIALAANWLYLLMRE